MPQLKMQSPKVDIVGYFEGASSRIFTRSDIDGIFSENRDFWRISSSTTVHQFIEFLLASTKLQQIKLEFPSRNLIRYSWGEPSVWDLATTLSPNSYFSHYSAVNLHDLTEQVPNVIYVNSEQPRKFPDPDSLTQQGIDGAFKRPVRVSKNIASFQNWKICRLNGMYTGKLGVVGMMVDSASGEIPITNIERTLIDITVRPVYSGGVFEVLKAFERAKGKVSTNRMGAMLKKINFVYPYHQAIGFYLERAGYKETAIKLFRKFDMKFDFHLAHNIKEKSYSESWRLYFPKGL